MKSIKNQIQKASNKASATIIKRENFFSSKSENWQESDKGCEYQEKTEELIEALSLINEGLEIFPE